MQEYPIMKTLKRNPLLASAISKAIEQPNNNYGSGIRDPETGAIASLGEFNTVSAKLQQELHTFDSLFQLFPDLNIDRMILVGGILAPNNMFKEDLNYQIENDKIDPQIAGQVIQVIEDRINNSYGFIDELRKIVDNALITKGAHVKVMLPESAVDFLINDPEASGQVRIESVDGLKRVFSQASHGLGLLGNKTSIGSYRQESYRDIHKAYDPTVRFEGHWEKHLEFKPLLDRGMFTVTDDFSKIKLPFYKEAFAREMILDRLDLHRKTFNRLRTEAAGSSSILEKDEHYRPKDRHRTVDITQKENAGTINVDRLRSAVFKPAPNTQELFTRVPRLNALKRHSIGECLYIDAPMEAFIPVHYPGQPDKHLGYFALLDANTGSFISYASNRAYITQAANTFATSNTGPTAGAGFQGQAASLIERAKNNLVNSDLIQPLMFHPEIFGNLLVEDFLERLKNGPQGFEVEAEFSSSISYVMLGRALAGRQTQVLYLPAEFVSYFAFDFNENGTGKSLLSGVKNLLSLRAASLYSRVANQIRNAISITDVNVTLDERDHNPQKTLDKIVDLVMQSRSQLVPWGLNTASDIWNWWNRAGYQLNVEGHPGIQRTKIEYSVRNADHSIPDTGGDEFLSEMVGHHFGITPEMKDAGKGAEFATSIVNNNILFAKRTHGLQQTLNPQLASHIRKLVYADGELFAKVRRVLKENWTKILVKMDDQNKEFYKVQKEEDAIDSFMREVIESLKIELPPPETTTVQNQSSAFKEYCEAVDDYIDQTLKMEVLSNTIFQEDTETAESYIELLRGQLKREWAMKNGYMEEVQEVSALTENGKAESKTWMSANEYTLALGKNLIEAIRSYRVIGSKLTQDIQILSSGLDAEGGGDISSSDDSSSDEEDTTEDSGDDLDLGFDDEEPEEETGDPILDEPTDAEGNENPL